MNKRAIILVLDSVGIGEMPDAADFGDSGSNTLKHIYEILPGFSLPNLESLGLGAIQDTGLAIVADKQTGAYGKMAEVSSGKDTTTGHWEMAGIQLSKAFKTYPNGFDEEIINEFTAKSGYGILCNKPMSGTEVIKIFGEEHRRTKKLIVYTSADSVFQIAAHEETIPLDELYRVCEVARKILDKHHVSRVIARPFIGTSPGNFTRTPNRRDFAMVPFEKTMLDHIKDAGLEVAGVGKIGDIFAERGLTKNVHTVSNDDGIDKTLAFMKEVQNGLIFTNLVDFDMLYGHRNNVNGYADALKGFDERLPEILQAMNEQDLLLITADHGCDPTTSSTDHSREYVPLLVYKKGIRPTDLGIRSTFSDLGQTVIDYLDVNPMKNGTSFLSQIL